METKLRLSPYETEARLPDFLRYLEVERRVSANTVLTYRYSLRGYLRHLEIGGTQPAQMTRETVLAYLDDPKRRSLTPSTRHQAVFAIRLYHRFLRLKGYAETDPTANIPLPRVDHRLPQPLTVAEVEKFLAAPKGSKFIHIRNRAILELLYATGLRISELTGLQASQTDLKAGYLRVRGKGGKERIVPFGGRARKAVRGYLAARKKKFPGVAEPMFLNIHGHGLTRGNLWQQLKDYARRAGITRRVSPHVIRHSFATHMLSGGADLRAIQEMLGHRRITTTEIYTHVEPDHLRRVWDRAHPLR
ncbi:MAG: site-specific tyrosine recombinase/integron integrase [Elusimicrobiota bacterium]